jgi:hypothetical protein
MEVLCCFDPGLPGRLCCEVKRGTRIPFLLLGVTMDYEHRQTEHIILKPRKEANNTDANIVFIILLVRIRI